MFLKGGHNSRYRRWGWGRDLPPAATASGLRKNKIKLTRRIVNNYGPAFFRNRFRRAENARIFLADSNLRSRIKRSLPFFYFTDEMRFHRRRDRRVSTRCKTYIT